MKQTALMFFLFLCYQSSSSQNPNKAQNKSDLCELIDLRSDTLFLQSFIGKFTSADLKALKNFLHSEFVTATRNKKENYGSISLALTDSLDKIIKIQWCKASTFRQDKNFNTKLEREIIKPLLKLADENYGVCGMCFDIIM